ncbi:MAG: hypothetical protein OEW04_07265, partial [Nitrospirota bacterium]|nr:hypothetical protein [Nitrospirota bacterium]
MINTGQVLNGREWLANGTALLIRLYSLHFTIFLSLLFFASVVFGETTQIKSDQHLISGDSPKQDALSQMREADALPAQVLIPGVPFISWQEAARIKYPDKNIVNPSIVASFGMVFKFLGKDEKLIESRDFAKSSGLQVVSDKSSGKSWTIRDLKASLAQRHPVVVALPLTPMAHPLYFTFELFIKLGQIKGVALNDKGRPRSNALGRMMSLEDLKKIADQIEMNPIRESVLIAGRVVIGYNDDKKVFIVHDPTFGPAFEFSYDDFDKMWEAADR